MLLAAGVTGSIFAHSGILNSHSSLRDDYTELKNESAGYAIAIPRTWQVDRSVPYSGIPTAAEDDGRHLEALNIQAEPGQTGTAPLWSATLTVTFFEKQPEESVLASLQRRGEMLSVPGLIEVSPIVRRRTFRADSSHAESLGIDATDVKYYIDDGDRVYYIGFSYRTSTSHDAAKSLQTFDYILNSFRLLREDNYAAPLPTSR